MKRVMSVFLGVAVIALPSFVAHAGEGRKPASDCKSKAIDVAIAQFNKDYNYPHKKPIATEEESTTFKVEIPQGAGSDIGDIYYHVELNNSCTSGNAIEHK